MRLEELAPDALVLRCPVWPARHEGVPGGRASCAVCAATVAVAHSSRPVLDAGAVILCEGCVNAAAEIYNAREYGPAENFEGGA